MKYSVQILCLVEQIENFCQKNKRQMLGAFLMAGHFFDYSIKGQNFESLVTGAIFLWGARPIVLTSFI